MVNSTTKDRLLLKAIELKTKYRGYMATEVFRQERKLYFRIVNILFFRYHINFQL